MNYKTWDEYVKETKKDNETAKMIHEEIEDITSIIYAIYQKRHELGYSQRDLAKLCGFPQSTIARFEKNIVSPNLDTLIKIMRPLGLTIKVVSI